MESRDENYQIQCFSCEKWLSTKQVQVSLDCFVPYMTNYEYTCQDCGTESIAKKAASFIQVAITAIANLMARHIHDDPPVTHFSLEDEILPFVWEKWDFICTKRSKTGNWKANLSTKLSTESIFSVRGGKFGLADPDLSTIGPRRYESKTVPGKSAGKLKRKLDSSVPQVVAKKAKGDGVTSSRGMSHGYPLEHPYNKDGYRYILAEQDPHSSIVIEPEDLAGRPIPPELYRPLVPTRVLLALHDRAIQLKVAEDRCTVVGDKGYCMVRATHGVSEGTWYYEVCINEMSNEGCAVRLGWAQSLANLQAPCGYDKLSYSWRSKKGTKFHQSRGKHYSEGFTTGDTVGFLIHLPPAPPAKGKKATSRLPLTYKDKPLIKFKNHFYFEEKDDTVEEFEKTLKPLKGSKIVFFKNGVSQGEAFTDIYRGTYFPALSLFRPAVVTAHFGPEFKHPPSTSIPYQPMSEVADHTAVRQLMSEMLFHVESKVMSRTTAQYPSNYKFSQISS